MFFQEHLTSVYCVRRKPAIAAWGSGSFAGCLSHTGSIRGCQAEGPGFSFLEHSPDSLPHLVPRGEFRAKFLKIFVLPTRCHTCPEAFPQLCSSPVLSQHFSIYSSVLKSDWHAMIEETKLPPPPGVCTYMHAPSNYFFSSFYMGYLHLKMREEKKKRRGIWLPDSKALFVFMQTVLVWGSRTLSLCV